MSTFLICKQTSSKTTLNVAPIQNALVYISFCAALKKSDNRDLGRDAHRLTFVRMSTKSCDTGMVYYMMAFVCEIALQE